MGGQNLISLSTQNREYIGVSAGETVDVELEVDTQPRIVEVPEDLAAAMAAEPTAQEFYATLSYSSQRRYVEPVGEAKTADTRARRIAKVVADLKAGKNSRAVCW